MVFAAVAVLLVMVAGAIAVFVALARGKPQPRATHPNVTPSGERRLGSFIGHVLDTADHRTKPRSGRASQTRGGKH
jgi:hypothetical protein